MNQHKIKVVFNESEKNNKKQTNEKILKEDEKRRSRANINNIFPIVQN
jgi:hypothetical protein